MWRRNKPSAALIAEASDLATSPERLRELARNARLLPIVVANPAAPLDVLDEVYQRITEAKTLPPQEATLLRQALTGNPNTRVENLLALVAQAPRTFLANPVIPLLLLERPDLFDIMGEPARIALLQLPELPPHIVKLLGKGAETLPSTEQAHFHVNYPVTDGWEKDLAIIFLKYIDHLAVENYHLPAFVPQWVTEMLLERGKVTPDILASQQPLSADSVNLLTVAADPSQRQRLAGYRYAPPDTLRRLAADQAWIVRVAVAGNSRAPDDVLALLVTDNQQSVRRTLAFHSSLTADLIARLLDDLAWRVRQALARHPQLSPEQRVVLANDPHPLVRGAVAQSPHTPPDELAPFFGDDAFATRAALARHPHLTPAQLRGLAADPHPQVRVAVAAHAQTPADVIGALTADPNHDVVVNAIANQHLPDDLMATFAQSNDVLELEALARNPATPPAILARLTQSAATTVRQAAARHPRLSPAALADLIALEQVAAVLRSAARSPQLTAVMQQQLVRVFGKRPQMIGLLRQILRFAHPDETARHTLYVEYTLAMEKFGKRSALRFGGGFAAPETCCALSAHITDAVMLEHRARGDNWPERLAIAHNPFAPDAVLASLAGDANRFVRLAAQATLADRVP